MSIECEMEVFGHCGPFDDELITGRFDEAVERIRGMDPVQAVQLILATFCRSDSVIERREMDDLAAFMGVFTDDDDGPRSRPCADCGGKGFLGDEEAGSTHDCASCSGIGSVPA